MHQDWLLRIVRQSARSMYFIQNGTVLPYEVQSSPWRIVGNTSQKRVHEELPLTPKTFFVDPCSTRILEVDIFTNALGFYESNAVKDIDP